MDEHHHLFKLLITKTEEYHHVYAPISRLMYNNPNPPKMNGHIHPKPFKTKMILCVFEEGFFCLVLMVHQGVRYCDPIIWEDHLILVVDYTRVKIDGTNPMSWLI